MQRRDVSAESRLANPIELEEPRESQLPHPQTSDAERQRQRDESEWNHSEVGSKGNIEHSQS